MKHLNIFQHHTLTLPFGPKEIKSSLRITSKKEPVYSSCLSIMKLSIMKLSFISFSDVNQYLTTKFEYYPNEFEAYNITDPITVTFDMKDVKVIKFHFYKNFYYNLILYFSHFYHSHYSKILCFQSDLNRLEGE